jgi:glutamyl-tRNA(Gln) amidotransferase subunit D
VSLYSEELQKLFNASKIEVGDKIDVESGSLKVHGELMPSTEAGNKNIVVIKLENGYNVGIAYSQETKIKKTGVGTKNIKFPKRDAGKKAGLPDVTLLYTGGTIGSKIDYKTGGVYMLLEPGELLYEVPELSEIANLRVKQLFSIASEDMSYLEWQKIAKEIEVALNSGSHGVVITMGTDTMHYTAAALSFMLKDLNAPVVITGAQRSSDRGSSDAFFNLMCAVELAAKSDIAEVGICMHATSSDEKCMLVRGNRARKMHTSRRDAFRPINDRPIAYVDRKLDITYSNDYNKVVEELEEKTLAETKFEPKVSLVKSYPNSDPEIIDFYVKKGYRGIIIEGTGLGHVPASTEHADLLWLDHVKRAVEKGVVVGMTSQTLYGRVNRNVYRNLRLISDLGVVYCEDMLPETAYIKLGWLLGNYKPEEAKKLLDKNIAREIKNRSRVDEFLI